MRRIQTLVAVGMLTVLAACTDVWAGGIAKNIATGLGSIKSYRGVTVESGIDAQPVERQVLYSKPSSFRVETVSSGPHQGELFLYDGDTLTLWYPQQLFGIRIRGLHAPTGNEVFRHIERLTRKSLDAYTFALQDQSARVAGKRSLVWLVRPARKALHRMVHRVWNHDPTTLPLKMEFWRDDKTPWYSFEFKELAFDVVVPPDAFSFSFPKNAVVFEWNLEGPALTLADARESMNFTVRVPSRLPAGHRINKIVRTQHCLPMIVMTMDHGGSMLSLIQSRYSGIEAVPLGIDISLGNIPAKLTLMGTISVVSWVQDGTLLTLTGNLDFPTMIDIAASVQ